MKRPLLFAALVGHLFAVGCTTAPTQSAVLGPNDNPDEVASAIIRRGQGEGPPPPERPDELKTVPEIVAEGLLLTGVVTGVAVGVCLLGALYLALRTWPLVPDLLTNSKHH